MSCETQANPSMPQPKEPGETQNSIQEIAESFKAVGSDIEQIVKLTKEEKVLVKQFFASLQRFMVPLVPSIPVSSSVLPVRIREGAQAHMDPKGRLLLMFEDGRMEVLDLRESRNRDLLMAIIGDIMPKLKNLTSQTPSEKLPEPLVQESVQVPEIPPAEPLPEIGVEAPVDLADSVPLEVPVEAPETPEVPEVPSAPVLSAEEAAKIAFIEAETLEYLEVLGNEVFLHSPISRFFDDWMVNLRQVILSFESSGVITADEEFTKECTQIFSDVEDELANRLLKDAKLEASTKTLQENKHLLGEIDAGYAAQNKELVVKGKSAIDFLIKNMQHLEEELAQTEQIKTSYLHPLKKIAKEQKLIEVSLKLSIAKKRLALAVQSSAVEEENLGDIDAEYAAQSRDLAAKRKVAMDFLAKNVHELEDELARIEQTKTSNPLKKIALQQKQAEIEQRLSAAKKRLELAEQHSGVEQEKLREEYEKKKQAMMAKMQGLEREIASIEVDGSVEARKMATRALAGAVRALVQRKTAPPEDE